MKTTTAKRPVTQPSQHLSPAIAEERRRMRSIMALGRERNVDPTLVEAMLDAGTSVEAARRSIVVGDNREAFRPFATFTEQLRAVRNHAEYGTMDPRLK